MSYNKVVETTESLLHAFREEERQMDNLLADTRVIAD
jgi:hypothetical protein